MNHELVTIIIYYNYHEFSVNYDYITVIVTIFSHSFPIPIESMVLVYMLALRVY